MRGALSRVAASDEVKGQLKRESRKVKATGMFKHSQYQSYLSNFSLFDLKKLHKERTWWWGEQGKQYILSRGLCLTKATINKGSGTFSGSMDQDHRLA